MTKIIIKGETLPSWNKLYAGKHWSERKRMADYWHELVGYTCIREKTPKMKFPGRQVSIEVTCYFKNRAVALDPDNICIKLAIDGLKGVVIEDDDYKHVKRVGATSYVDVGNPRTEILIMYI